MKKHKITSFTNGWFIGDFSPSLFQTKHFEICAKFFKAGELEPNHFQIIATEVTLVISGLVRMGEHILEAGDILVIECGEACDFEALSDSHVIGVKFPSIPNDKVLA